ASAAGASVLSGSAEGAVGAWAESSTFGGASVVPSSGVSIVGDHGAGSIVVEEAGGTVTDVTGTPLDFSLGRTLANNRGIIATNGRFHDEVVSAVQSVIG
ncbi:MAG: inositol monophosphatase family protein, partial [Planctomycetota bacterium]